MKKRKKSEKKGYSHSGNGDNSANKTTFFIRCTKIYEISCEIHFDSYHGYLTNQRNTLRFELQM